ncbi:GNAT family N-acetyltransferase [Xiashengella succiniciproducens]|uniref:GNAT family N-acetyltransferase n=1 Tax=Xiashengella succiniciproducens TaxID=2949635 RepID=A0A9J6ZQ15_9BACT|nr:GNAT family N-acetyltransferase [Alkaliflexus sp. Ai-910]URW80028.1 GNAT family N-acetyltransferase [Alkaliflexus sp. Ai-910]
MKIVKVSDKRTVREFLDVVDLVYKNDKVYVRPLDAQIEAIFDPAVNKFFQHGSAERFILVDDNGKTIGRVAAFINERKAYGFDQPTGGMGFFECINNKDAAYLLFETAKTWLAEKGMQAMDGPINFGENDSFWGLLTEGYTHPAFGMPYNPPYYKEFFESYGFTVYFEQVTKHLDVVKPFPERFWSIAKRVVSKPEYRFRHFDWKEADKFIADFVNVYNNAWQFHENFSPMQPEDLLKTLQEAKAFMDEELIWFAYDNEDPIGFIIIFPDVNQIIKHFKGKMNFINKLKFVYYKWKHEMTRARVVIMGIKPRYQRLGIESGLFYNLKGVVARKTYMKELELSWVGDFNPKMRALMDATGADDGKIHLTYRYLFDPEKRAEQQRAGSIPADTKYKLAEKE